MRVSGARLILEKSTIIPLDDDFFPDWFSQTGCKIAQPKEVLSFLGCPIRGKDANSKEAEFFMYKVRKRVNHWANWSVSLQGLLVLLKHVLRAILVFHFMALTLSKDGLKDLE